MNKFYLCFVCIIGLISINLEARLFRRSDELYSALVCRTTPVAAQDENLVPRIVKAYQLSNKKNLGNSMWQLYFEHRHRSIHDLFLAGRLADATYILRNPGANDLFYGIDGLCASGSQLVTTPFATVSYARECLDGLIRFGEAIGVANLDYPEAHHIPSRKWDVSSLINTLETFLGFSLQFPNPYPDELGVWTHRGVVSYRVPQALYQAYLIKKLLQNIPNPKVLEIGGGLGRTAYYARMFGIRDYTIIDIPIVATASSYFLGRTLGEDQILLLGETSNYPEKCIKILTPDQFLNGNESYDLIINVDSLTEMDISNAKSYIDKIKTHSSAFLSINHEANHFTVKQLLASDQSVTDYSRNYYWLRDGYCEELFKFK